MKGRLAAISSPWTPWVRWVPVAFWLAFLAIAAHGVATQHEDRGFRILSLLVFTPLLLAWFLRNWRLLDAVHIEGSELHLYRRGVEQRVPLMDVMTVIPGVTNMPTFVRIRLRRPGPLGDEVRFASRPETAPGGSWWAPRLEAVESLIAAVDAAKLGRWA